MTIRERTAGLPGRSRQTTTSLFGPVRTPRADLVLDVCFAVFIFLVGLPSAFANRPDSSELWLRLALTFALSAPIVWRRRRPMEIFALLSLVALAQLVANERLAADVALLATFYTISTRESLRRTAAAAGVLELGVLFATLRWAPSRTEPLIFVLLSGMTTAAFFIGTTMRTRRTYLSTLEDRAARLEQEAEQQALLVAAAERARIARDMHDIVAHNLSVMIALADGASLIVPVDSARAATAMANVSETGRAALTEMRRLLGVLREDQSLTLAPQPGLADLDQLLAQVRMVGLRGELVTEGRPPEELTAGLQLIVYRMVQESLTNILKHAVGATAAVVRLRFQPGRLDIEVTDDGAANPAAPRTVGHGINGMRERAAVYGGVVEAGPSAGSGWRVRSAFDLRASA